MRALFLIMLSAVPALGESFFIHDGKAWDPLPDETRLAEAGGKSLTLIASSATPMSECAGLLGMMRKTPARSLTLRLRREKTGVTLGVCVPETGILVPDIALTIGDRGAAIRALQPLPDGMRGAHLGSDLAGLHDFLKFASACFSTPKEGEGPAVARTATILARSDAGFGLVVTVMQILTQCGCKEVDLMVDDEFPGFDVALGLDRNVEVPKPRGIAGADPRGRIVVKIDQERRLLGRDGEILGDEVELQGYLRKHRQDVERRGLEPIVYLRPHHKVPFSVLRKVIRVASSEGLNEVISATYRDEEGKLEPEDRDAAEKLPKGKGIGGPPDVAPFFIKIDVKGRVYTNTGEARELLDRDPVKGKLPLLDRHAERYAAAARRGQGKPQAQILVETGAAQSRVMDVLNVLRKHGIDRVTFVDLADDE